MGDQVVSVDLEVDVADPDAIGAAVAAARPKAIYHLAALSHVGESWEVPGEVLRGRAGVLAASRALPEPAVVLVISSAEVYGSVSAEELPIVESTALRPLSPY